MPSREPDSLERLTPSELIGVVRELIGEVRRLHGENEKLNGALAKLKVEHQAVKDELARLKGLPPRRRTSRLGWIRGRTSKGRRLSGGRASVRRAGAAAISTSSRSTKRLW